LTTPSSCAHCNSVKNQQKYHDTILDCCQIDPEKMLEQLFIDGTVDVKPLCKDKQAIMIAKLITECFEKNTTGIKTLESKTLKRALQKTMDVLFQLLKQYKKNPAKERNLAALRGLLDRKHKFAGFIRTYVRNHLKEYPVLTEYVKIS